MIAEALSSRAAHDFPRIHWRMINRADALNLVGDQMILLIEKEHAKFLMVEEGHRGTAVIEDRGETRQRRMLFDRGFGETFGRRLDNLQLVDRGIAQPLDLAQTLGARRHDLGERAEAGDKSLRERLDVAPRHGAEKNELEQFILAQGIGAALAESVAQPLPVAEVMRRVGGG